MSSTPSSAALAPIAPLDLEAERRSLGPALEEAVLSVLRSGRYVLGPEVERLEADMARRSGVDHGIGVASGTDALVLALRALGLGRGDRVVTSPFTFFASAGTIAWTGAEVVLADVELDTGLLDAEAAARAVDGRTKALLPVHLYGQMADVRALRDLADAHGLKLIEDAAQAHGSARDGLRPGELGDAATFSFYPTKNLGAAGEGGLVVTRHGDVAENLRLLRDHGSSAKYVHDFVGTNSRLQALQAAVLNVKAPHLDGWNARRGEIAARYDAGLEDHARIVPLRRRPETVHVYHQYAVRITAGADRDAVHAKLAEEGIHAAVHYPRPVHLQPAAKEFGFTPGSFPNAETLAREILCLPVHPFLADGDVDRVIETLRAAAQ